MHPVCQSLKLMQAEAEEDARMASMHDARTLGFGTPSSIEGNDKGSRARGRVEIMDDTDM